jgi:hypothetical protein
MDYRPEFILGIQALVGSADAPVNFSVSFGLHHEVSDGVGVARQHCGILGISATLTGGNEGRGYLYFRPLVFEGGMIISGIPGNTNSLARVYRIIKMPRIAA